MTKRIVSAIVLAGLVIGSSDAFASRAREAVLGRGDAKTSIGGYNLDIGSFYYDSEYNMFYNPAYVNDFKNWAIIEKGPLGPNTVTTNGAQSGAQTAEGGFATSIANFNVAVFFNRANSFNTPVVLNNPVNVIRPIDLVIGGDMGVKWGLGVTYAGSTQAGNTPGAVSATNSATSNAQTLTGRFGLSIANFDPFVSYKIIGREHIASSPTGTSSATEKSRDWSAGLRYHFGEWTPYAVYRNFKDKTSTTTPQGKGDSVLGGIGRNMKVAENVRIVYAVAYGRLMTKDFATGQNNARTQIPLNVGIEGDVLSWLTLRGGLVYNFMDRTSGGNNTTTTTVGTNTGNVSGTIADNTTARVGASFHISKVDVDWAFGSTNGGNGLDSNSFGFDSQTFSNVSVAYRW